MSRKRWRLGIFGLGYVGCVTAACFAKLGHKVVGVDVNPDKVRSLNAGDSPIVEPGLPELLASLVRRRSLSATMDAEAAVRASDLCLICVGTPGGANGSPDFTALFKVCRQIGMALKRSRRYKLIVIRSTCLPGTAARAARAVERASGLVAGRDFGVCVNPEFLREGTAIADFHEPPYTVVGVSSSRDAKMLRSIYAGVKGEFVVTETKVAETIKYASNSFHAVKVTFANEVGAVCKALGIDSHVVMDVFCRDAKLNLSRSYLRPGFAFGGSCLPKDLRALSHMAKMHDVEAPLLDSTLSSNQRQIDRLVDRLVDRLGKMRARRIGVVGLAFKSGTDDLRESPMVRVVEALLGKGFEVRVFDPNVSLARLMGANKAYIENEIPHLSRLLRPDLVEVIEQSDLLVLGGRDGLSREALSGLRRSHVVVDLVRALPESLRGRVRYEGLYW